MADRASKIRDPHPCLLAIKYCPLRNPSYAFNILASYN